MHHSSGRLNFTDKFYTDAGLFFVASEFEGKSCINLHLHVNVIIRLAVSLTNNPNKKKCLSASKLPCLV